MTERGNGRPLANHEIPYGARGSRLREAAAVDRAQLAGRSRSHRRATPYSRPHLTVSVIVPVHNGGAAFARCLESLQSLSPAPEEILVVADGETDGSARLAERRGVTVMRTGRQSGPAVARNLGARLAKGDLLFFIDADVTVRPTAIREIRDCFTRDRQLDALLGSYDDEPAACNFLSQYKNLFHHYTHQQARPEGYTFWGACGAIRREVFEEIGGFDESYRHPCVEDIELGYRLRAAGYRIRLCKQLQVKHLKRWGVRSLFWADFFGRALPWTQLILRSGRFDNDLNIRRTARAKVLLLYLVLALAGLVYWWPPAGLWAVLTGALLLLLDVPLLRFFYQKRGISFALRTVPWHWFHYGYSGAAFGIGLARHLFASHRWSPFTQTVAVPALSHATPQNLEASR